MNGVADFARSIVAYAKACLAGTVTFFALASLGQDFSGYGDDPARALLVFGIVLFYGTLIATPFALVVLLVLRLSGSRSLLAATVGGAIAAVLPAVLLALAAALRPADLPPALLPPDLVLMLALAGAAGGATYGIARRPANGVARKRADEPSP